jgi:hypothetical protein
MSSGNRSGRSAPLIGIRAGWVISLHKATKVAIPENRERVQGNPVERRRFQNLGNLGNTSLKMRMSELGVGIARFEQLADVSISAL